jgi:hypothetical protein
MDTVGAHVYISLYTYTHIYNFFVGPDHLRTKIIINDETLEQVNQFIYYIEYPKKYNLEIATKKTKVLYLVLLGQTN